MQECCDKCLLKCFAANVDLETLKHQHCMIQHSLRSQEIRKHRFKYHHIHSIFFLFSVLLCALQAFSFSLFSSFHGLPWQTDSRCVPVQKKTFFLWFPPPTWSLYCLAHGRLVCCCCFCGCVLGMLVFFLVLCQLNSNYWDQWSSLFRLLGNIL